MRLVYSDEYEGNAAAPQAGREHNKCLPYALQAHNDAKRVARLDEKARTAAANSLLKTYNESWRDYQEETESGDLVDVTFDAPVFTDFHVELRAMGN